VIVNRIGDTETDPFVAAFCVGLLLSVTVAIKLATPLAVGVPVIAPVVERASPAGRLPEVTAHLYGAVPPVACRVCE
jgi:hypothetical protein